MLSDININKYRQVYRRIQAASNILLVTHGRPDGDALASICSLIELVESLNKKYVAYCQDEPTHNFSFLPHIEKIISIIWLYTKIYTLCYLILIYNAKIRLTLLKIHQK